MNINAGMDINHSIDVTNETNVKEMCDILEKKYCDTAVLVLHRNTGVVSTFGSNIGNSFFAKNPLVITMFTDFCNDKEKSLIDTKDNNDETIALLDNRKVETIDSCFTQEEKIPVGTYIKKSVDENGSKFCLEDSSQSGQNNTEAESKNVINVTIEEQPTFECKPCGKTFKSRAGLSTHEKYIHEEFKDKAFSLLKCDEKIVKLLYTNKEGKQTSGLRCSMYEKLSDNTNIRYCCNICSYSTDKYNGIIEHTQTHVIMDLLTCSLCDKAFKVKKSLWRHTQQHKKLPHMCKKCLKMFKNKDDLELHQASHKSSHMCDICGRKYDCIGRLNYHKKLSHGPKLVKCDVCGSSYSSQSLLRQHMKRHGSKQFFCDKCNNSYFFMHQLTNHLKTHDENYTKYKCAVCPKEYVSMSHWKEHMKVHDGSNFVKCDQCGKSYCSRKTLNLHKKTKHLEERKFVCQVCDKAFLTKHYLKNHLISHDDKRDYKCRFCDATFKKNDVLKMHENVHTKEQKFICDVCGEYFLRRSSLRNHRLSHFPGLGRWKCRYCENKFKNQSGMMTHIKNRHADEDLAHERPLCRKCRHCGKVYAKGLTFRIHMDTHAGVKRYKCRVCKNAFTDPANLRVHMKIHDGTERFRRHICDICDLRFSSTKQLRLHEATHSKLDLFENQTCKRIDQQESLGLSSADNQSSEILTDKDGSCSNRFVSGESERTLAVTTLQTMGNLDSSLILLNASHGLVGMNQQLLTSSYFSNADLLMPMNRAEITNLSTRLINSENKITDIN